MLKSFSECEKLLLLLSRLAAVVALCQRFTIVAIAVVVVVAVVVVGQLTGQCRLESGTMAYAQCAATAFKLNSVKLIHFAALFIEQIASKANID